MDHGCCEQSLSLIICVMLSDVKHQYQCEEFADRLPIAFEMKLEPLMLLLLKGVHGLLQSSPSSNLILMSLWLVSLIKMSIVPAFVECSMQVNKSNDC